MYDNIDTMREKFEKEEEKSYHLCFLHSFLYFMPGLTIALLSLIMQKEKLRINIDPSHAISKEGPIMSPTYFTCPCRQSLTMAPITSSLLTTAQWRRSATPSWL
jgi:hypothetical protein